MAGQDEQLSLAVEAQEEALEAMAQDEGLPEAPVGPKQLSFSFAKRNQVLLETNETPAVLYFTENTPFEVFAEVRRFYGEPFVPKTIASDEFEHLLTSAFQRDSSAAKQLMEDLGNESDLFALAEDLPDTEDLLDSEDDAPIIKLINAMLGEAIKEGASDIHIETFENQLVVRFRVDGVLREILRPNRKLSSMLVSRIKVMAKLDIAEKRVPQDGRITLRIAGRAVDVRVSTMPSSHGERVVLRLLDKNNARLNLEDLGMTKNNRGHFSSLIRKPHGIILVTGPTGSGKSTTLYAGLSEINSRDRNILTVEDPIEFDLPGIGQTQVNPRVDMTFARGLRAILRQDPDVVMVGEIRDIETAQIAVQASLTGHLVLSTLHTNTAAGAITRLEDMGIEPFLLSSSLLAVLSQRLVRTLCTECKKPHSPDTQEKEVLGISANESLTIYTPHGCAACNQTGYRGRTGIHELLIVDEKIREMMHEGVGEQAIEKHIRHTTPSIREDGCRKVLAGITALEEVLRVTRED
ncbi:MAG: type II secretion system protein GspE [Alteromonas sp.]|uniref:Type II secretion system protein E n=1 Tax=Alteromonas australica TaxID=589873 RepID=A0A075PB00_9ALTE|nr:type II secretion system ATPase GspE [Alteromonas australica]AIG00523.1 general secretion pathway protein GspE [Alteromonas australica]MAO29170.1 type II secretion system protein GspE [Alteromonas sp.]HBF70839.1 type II secretion system protein GspE [Alteromonas australica]|tara:strand:+ start:7896 stop:9461 length:1566 start_codon:yes stop_codon:yes gene_type:complete